MNLFDIYKLLSDAYGKQHWWPADTAFEMMTGAILTQNTSWSNVEYAIANFGTDLTPEYILSCPLKELKIKIRPSGFYNQKALRLKYLAEWFAKYDYDIEKVKSKNPEKLRTELLKVNGIGNETADSILLYAFEKTYFVIDSYTKRIFTRLGFNLPDNYDEIRIYFESRIPRSVTLYNEYHALIVKLAKTHCKTFPICNKCPLEGICPMPAALDKSSPML